MFSLDPSDLPTPLAWLGDAIGSQDVPVLQLWGVCDLAEQALRLHVAIGVSQRRGRLSDEVARVLVDRCLWPTLGHWIEMAEAVADDLHADADPVVPELEQYSRAVLGWIGRGDKDIARSVYALRNRLAHGVGFPKALAREIAPGHVATAAEVLGGQAWLRDVGLVTRDRDGAGWLLRGPRPVRAALDATAERMLRDAPAGSVLLCRAARLLPLWPLVAYAPSGPAREALAGTAPSVPMTYWRRDRTRLEMTPLAETSYATAELRDPPALDAFDGLFRMRDRACLLGEAATDFDAELREEASRLVGRREEMRTLVATVRRCPGGVLWLHGLPGSGKSGLMAKAFAALSSERGSCVIAYRFPAGDPRSTRRGFLQHAIRRLESWLRIPSGRTGEDLAFLERRFAELLGQVGASHQVILLLDALDELIRWDPAFPREIPLRHCGTGVIWLCAGRPLAPLEETFVAAPRVFPQGLPRMTAEEVGEWLKQQAPPLQRDLIVGPEKDDRPAAWVELVALRSDGLPAYVTLLLDELAADTLRAGQAVPAGLVAYFDRLLDRAHADDRHVLLPVILAILALAVGAPDVETIEEVLRRAGRLHPGTRAMHRELVEAALASARSLVIPGPGIGDVVGYRLYHDELRAHLASTPRLRDSREWARDGWISIASKPPGSSLVVADRHACEIGVRQLVTLGRADLAGVLLTDFSWVARRLVLGGGSEVYRILGDHTELRGDPEPERRAWYEFLGRSQHRISRGGKQSLVHDALACDLESPVRRAAEAWLGGCSPREPHLRVLATARGTGGRGCLRVLEGHQGAVTALALLAEAPRAVSGGVDGTLRLWDLTTGRPESVIHAHRGQVAWVVDLRPAATALSGGADGSIRQWDLRTGLCLRTLCEAGSPTTTGTAVTSRQVLSGGADGILRIWDLDSGVCARELPGHVGGIRSVGVYASGARAVSVGWDRTLRVWDLGEARCTRSLPLPDSAVNALQVVSDRRAVVARWDGELRVIDLETGREEGTLRGHVGEVRGICALPTSGRLVSAGADRSLRLWDLEERACLAVWEGHQGEVLGVIASESRQQALSASADGTLRLWALGEPAQADGHDGHRGGVRALTLLPGGRNFLSASTDRTARLWDLDTATCLRTWRGHAGWVRAVVPHPCAPKVLSSSTDGTLRVWDLDSNESQAVIRGHEGGVTCIALFEGGEHAITSSIDQTLRLWDLATGECRRVYAGHSNGVTKVVLLSGDTWALSSSWDGTLRLWEVATGRCLRELAGHALGVTGLRVVPGATWVVSSGMDGAAVLWDLDTGRAIRRFEGHAGPVLDLAVLPDGRWLVTAGEDRTLRVWDLGTGHPVVRWDGDHSMSAVAAGPGGCILAGNLVGDILSFRLEGCGTG